MAVVEIKTLTKALNRDLRKSNVSIIAHKPHKERHKQAHMAPQKVKVTEPNKP